MVDRGEAACRRIADLLRAGKNLDGIKLVECKAYLKKNGLSQTGDMATCVERIILHWRCKYEDPEKIYPRSSFCINCKGDVCRGDAVLFKQKVYEKSGKRHSKCIGKRVVAGRVIKESYGKEKQQHTFTVQVFWSKGVGKLPPLCLLLVKGRNLYRMMTFRQLWGNEVDRLKTLDEKHSRGDAARRVRALRRPDAAGNGKKSTQNGKHQSQPGRRDSGTNINKGNKRIMQSSNPDLPTKRSRNEENLVSSTKQCTGGRKAKTDRACLVKNDCTTRVRMRERKADSQQDLTGGSGSHAQFGERYAGSGSNTQPAICREHMVGMQQPHYEIMRPQGAPPFREVGNAWQPHIDGRSAACPHPRMGFQHRNAALPGWHPPAYSMGTLPNQPGASFASSGVPQTVHRPLNQFGSSFASFNVPQPLYRPCPEGHAMPHFRYSGGSNGFPR
uniref:DUF7699 domain-containing protein n=2 Tax=Oryza brachyantha TaxID=4533 RepID=J3MN16_ORYBR